MAPQDAEDDDEGGAAAARTGWEFLGRSMEDGVSWSGHERNRAWWNAGDGTFVDVSAIAGLDQVEDGRVALRCDWDGDGDEDLWLRSRNGPSLRYFENTRESARLFSVDAQTPVDAIYIEVQDDKGNRKRRDLSGGSRTDGYLASSVLGWTAPLEEGEQVVEVGYEMAGGSSGSWGSSAHLGDHFVLTADNGFIKPEGGKEERTVSLDKGSLKQTDLPGRVVLRTPYPLPQARAAGLNALPMASEGAEGRPQLVVLRSETCETCERLVPALVERLGDADPMAVRQVVLEDEATAEHAAFVRALAESVLGPTAELALPLSALLDAEGNVQVLYLGELDHGRIVRDTTQFAVEPGPAAERNTFTDHDGDLERGPRWFHLAPRSFTRLVTRLREAGLDADADIYAGAESGR